MNEKQKEWIDNASYEDLLRRWRFAPPRDTIFQGESGQYYTVKIEAKRIEVGNAAHVAASKKIGWEK